MSVTALESGENGALLCPECKRPLVYKDGGQVRVVDGKVDYENVKPRHVCFYCQKFYREMLHSGYYDVFDLDDELKEEAKNLHLDIPVADAAPAEKTSGDIETVVHLIKGRGGSYNCPRCNNTLRCTEGGAIKVIGDKVDYESIKPRFICDSCKVFYRELLTSGMYDTFPLEDEDQQETPEKNTVADINPVVALAKNGSGHYLCPACNQELEFSDGGQVRVVNGKVDYENVKPRYICRRCETFYRELLSSGLYERFDLEELTLPPERKKIIGTGDLEPMQLKRDENGNCACPRCGANMRYLEPEAVKIINGRADMRDTVARFACDECSSIYRRIATTDYYQWSEN